MPNDAPTRERKDDGPHERAPNPNTPNRREPEEASPQRPPTNDDTNPRRRTRTARRKQTPNEARPAPDNRNHKQKRPPHKPETENPITTTKTRQRPQAAQQNRPDPARKTNRPKGTNARKRTRRPEAKPNNPGNKKPKREKNPEPQKQRTPGQSKRVRKTPHRVSRLGIEDPGLRRADPGAEQTQRGRSANAEQPQSKRTRRARNRHRTAGRVTAPPGDGSTLVADLVRTGTRSRGVRAGNDRSGPGRQSGSGGRVEHRPIRRPVRFPQSASERNETGGAEERTASEASRTEKVEAVGAVFGSPVEIVLKREALKYAPHLGEHPVRYGPGERVLVAMSGFPERAGRVGSRTWQSAARPLG